MSTAADRMTPWSAQQASPRRVPHRPPRLVRPAREEPGLLGSRLRCRRMPQQPAGAPGLRLPFTPGFENTAQDVSPYHGDGVEAHRQSPRLSPCSSRTVEQPLQEEGHDNPHHRVHPNLQPRMPSRLLPTRGHKLIEAASCDIAPGERQPEHQHRKGTATTPGGEPPVEEHLDSKIHQQRQTEVNAHLQATLSAGLHTAPPFLPWTSTDVGTHPPYP